MPRAKIRQDGYFSVWDTLELIYLLNSSGAKSQQQIPHTCVHGGEAEEMVLRKLCSSQA